MGKPKRLSNAIVAASLVALIPATELAQAERANRMDATFALDYLNSSDSDFSGGSSVETHSDMGFGVGFDYHYSNQLSAGLDVLFHSIAYDATVITEDQGPQQYGGHLDTVGLIINGNYYFTPEKIAPYVTAGFGWTFVDTNVPDGRGGSTCWWDPWYGYICDYYQPTHTESTFTYGAGLGVRVEINRTSFFKVEYNLDYLDFDRSDGEVQWDGFRIEFGAMY